MKKILSILFAIILFAGAGNYAHAQVVNNLWKLSSNNLNPVTNSWGLQIPSLVNLACVGTNSQGVFGLGTCTGGGGSGGGTFSTTTSQVPGQLTNFPNNNTDIVTIGSNSTTTAKFYFDPNKSRSVIGNASSTSFTVSGNSYFNTISTGLWNGTAIGPTFGGTGFTTYATGDTIYASAANTLSKLTIGSVGQILAVVNGVPSWVSTTTFSSPLNYLNGNVTCQNASGSQAGCLSSTDWTTFNNKQPAGTYVTSVAVASANGLAGSSSGGATPTLTLSTSVTGVLKGNGSAISAASNGTDYTLVANQTCSAGQFVNALTASGGSTCGTPTGGGGGSGGSLLLYLNPQNAYYVATTSAQWLIGEQATTSNAILETLGDTFFKGNSTTTGILASYIQVTAPFFNATSTTASSTFANGINLTKGCYAISGTCLSSNGSGTVNSGTTGQTGVWASSGTAISATSSDFINTDSTSKFNASPSIANINASTTYGYEGTVNVNSLERSQVSVGLNIFNSAANGSSGVGIGLSNYDPLNTNGGIDPQEFNFVKDGGNFDVNLFWALQTPTTQSFGRTGIRNMMELHSGGNLDLLAAPNAVNNLATPCLTVNDGTGTQRGGGVQPIVGGNQLLDAALTKPCATNTLMIDGSQNFAALFYSKSTVSGDVLQPFAFFTNAEFFGVDPRNSGLGTGIPNHFFYVNDNQTASTSASDATEVYGNWSHSPANSGSGGCYMSFYLPGGSSTSTPIDNNHNSACIAAVNNYSLPSDSAGTFGIFSNPSAQYLTGFAQYSTNGGSIYNLDAWNYPYYFLDYLSGQTRFPYQTRDIGNPNQKAYIFTVSGITNAPVYVNSDLYSPDGTSSGRLYQISSYTQNLSGGAGPLTFIGTTTPPDSGVMTRIFPTSDSSDFSISYSAVSLAPRAMQWHDSVNFDGKLGLASFGTTTQATSTVTSSFTVTANATSTFSQGINILNGCFSIANICIGGGSGVSIDWLKENNTFGVNSLTPTTTIPLEIKSTASSTFAGGLSSFALLSAPYFNATSTATSTFNGPIQSTCFTTDNITCLNNTYANASAYKQASKYATTAALPANTYVNGAGGVGATLTEVGTGALSVDGASPSIGDRILVKNEVAGANNGIYTVTATGSGIAAYVLTRATDFNSSADVFPGVATYISAGTTNIDDVWALSNTSAVTIGTTALTFAEITSTPLITSVSNSDSTLTISPTTGAVVGSLNLSHANNWISQQNFAAYLGVGTTSPDFRLTVSAGAILNPDFVPGTTTSMTVSFATSTSQTIRIGSSATTINLINALPGAVLRLGIFNPTAVSAGAVTFTSPNNIHWVGAGSANTVPTQTTTAGAFDLWTFTVMSGTSTPVIEGAQLPY